MFVVCYFDSWDDIFRNVKWFSRPSYLDIRITHNTRSSFVNGSEWLLLLFWLHVSSRRNLFLSIVNSCTTSKHFPPILLARYQINYIITRYHHSTEGQIGIISLALSYFIPPPQHTTCHFHLFATLIPASSSGMFLLMAEKLLLVADPC